jgi:hypothetical protein
MTLRIPSIYTPDHDLHDDARALSDTFAGIAPGGVLAFIMAQLIGMIAAVGLSRRFWTRHEP